MNKITSTWLLALLVCLLSGCNTTRGVGQDIEAAGESIEEAANEAQDSLRDDDEK